MTKLATLALLLSIVACTGAPHTPFEPEPDSTIAFTPTAITFERFATQCGVVNPPFQPADLFALSVLGAAGVPRADINLSFQPDIPRQTPIDVALQPFGVIATSTDASGHTVQFFGQNGTLTAGSDTRFNWGPGADVHEIDPGPLSAVTIRVDAMPTSEGGYGEFVIDMSFVDGAVLDFSVAHPVHTEASGCPAG